MKFLSILLLSSVAFANPLSDSSVSSGAQLEAKLPATIIVKDGNIVGTLDEKISSAQEAQRAIESGNFKPARIKDEANEHLSDGANDSCFYCGHWGGYYNYHNYSYGFHYGPYHYPYVPYYNYGGYGFYHYSSYYYHRTSYYHGPHRYYWWW